MSGKVGDPVQRCPLQKVGIKFKFVDDETDELVENVSVLIKFLDGTERLYTSNNQGIIDIQNIDPGSCKISSDLKGVLLSTALDFVSINSQSNQNKESTQSFSQKETFSEKSQPEADNEESGSYRLANIKEYKVKTGDTLEKLASDAGISWQEISLFNWGTDNPKEINWKLREYVGCRKRTKDKRNYIFTSDDDPGIVFIPQKWSKGGLNTEEFHEIRLRRQYWYSPVEVQAVDEFGVRYGKVTLVLKSMNGLPDVEITTDKKGYGKKKKVLGGEYRVFTKDKGPAYFLKDLNTIEVDPVTKEIRFGKYTNAIFNTKNRDTTILRVVVSLDASKEAKETRSLIKQTYLRTGEEVKIDRYSEETKGFTRQSFNWCADNLVLAAGWLKGEEINIKALVSDTLKSYLNDYTPIDITRGYHVFVIESESKKVTLYNENGNIEKTFVLTQDLTGLYGAYASFPDVDEILFRDIASTTYTLYNPADRMRFIPLEDMVNPLQYGDFVESMNKHVNEETIIYFTPDAHQLAWIALHGGTGRLEDYGGDDRVKKSIHKRNITVCHRIRDVYNQYVDDYKNKVKKSKTEVEIRNLGKPLSPYEMPVPAGVTQTQLMDIFDASITNELDSWVAIAEQLDEINERLSQGHPYFRIKTKYKVKSVIDKLNTRFLRDAIPKLLTDHLDADAEVEWNLYGIIKEDLDFFQKKDASGKIKIRANVMPVVKHFLKDSEYLDKILDDEEDDPKKKNRFIEVGLQKYIANPEKLKVFINICDFFKFETDTLGKTKVSLIVTPVIYADIEVNPRIGTFGTGVTLSTKALTSKLLRKWPNSARVKTFCSYVDPIEVQVFIGFVSTREETILAIISYAPGFFERRGIDEFCKKGIKWNDLTTDERKNLATLGWEQASWDIKDMDFEEIPGSKTKEKIKKALGVANKNRNQLEPEEKIAIVHLGFHEYEEYGRQFRGGISIFANYSD